MCKEDIREGRRKYSRVTSKTFAGGATGDLVGFAEKRTHLSFGTAGTESIGICPDGLPVAGQVGFGLSFQGLTMIDFDVETHGDVVTKNWFAINQGVGPMIVCIIETFWDDPDK